MKKLTSLFIVTTCFVIMVMGCWHHGTSISVSDNNHYYSMETWFNVNRTTEVNNYLDQRLNTSGDKSFVSTRFEGDLSLDDHTSFYLRKHPGYLRVKFNKYTNSRDSYRHIQDICQGVISMLK